MIAVPESDFCRYGEKEEFSMEYDDEKIVFSDEVLKLSNRRMGSLTDLVLTNRCMYVYHTAVGDDLMLMERLEIMEITRVYVSDVGDHILIQNQTFGIWF